MLMVLILSPKIRITSMVISNDSGIDTSEISVVRPFCKKTNSTRITNNAPSQSDCLMLPIEPLIKLAWRNMSVDTCTSAGSCERISSIALSKWSVSSSVPVLGCLVTVSSTAGFPCTDATPRRGVCAPIATVATCSKRTVPPAMVGTAVCPSSSISLVESAPRMMYSLPYSYSTPPDAFWFMLRTAVNRSSSATP